jgi:hypothetical protein
MQAESDSATLSGLGGGEGRLRDASMLPSLQMTPSSTCCWPGPCCNGMRPLTCASAARASVSEWKDAASAESDLSEMFTVLTRMRDRRPPTPLASGVCACVMDYTSMSYNLQNYYLLSACRCGAHALRRSMVRRRLVAWRGLPPYQRKGESRWRRICRSCESC